MNISHSEKRIAIGLSRFSVGRWGSRAVDMSVLDDFVRMRLYRNRALEFELLAEAEPLPDARLRFRIIAQHYRELADREERSDKARTAQRLELLSLKRRQAAE